MEGHIIKAPYKLRYRLVEGVELFVRRRVIIESRDGEEEWIRVKVPEKGASVDNIVSEIDHRIKAPFTE